MRITCRVLRIRWKWPSGRVVVGVWFRFETWANSLLLVSFFERDGLTFEEPTPQLFSFNSPVGACPECQGLGRVAGIDEDLVIPNPVLSLRQGAIAPFRTEQWSEHYRELVRLAARIGLPIDVPYVELSREHQRIIWDGQDDYIGIRGFFKFLSRHNYKMHYRIFAARFRGYTRCPDCDGYRVRPQALYVKIADHHIGHVAELTIKEAYAFFNDLSLSPFEEAVAGRVLEEIRKRLKYLNEVGLDYLTLDRLSQTLSGGESQRINLATSLGSSLVGSLYVLDEPSIGLHPRDTDRLIRILEHLRDIGNTVIVVEHDAETMQRADHIVDLGPAAGMLGGDVVFAGPHDAILKDQKSLTGAYLSGRKEIPVPETRRSVQSDLVLWLRNARAHNLKRIDVAFPLRMITCVTGVSGSGKSTLVHDTLYAGLRRRKGEFDGKVGPHDAIEGHRLLDQVQMVDQTPIGRTPRSNPATYIKVFDDIRKLLSQTHQAKIRGYKPGYFSFNVPGGRCEVCQGEGFVKVEMQFLADLYLECEACKGRRFKKEVLEVRYKGKNVHDVLNMTVDEALEFFAAIRSISRKLKVLQDVGLGYLKLGQPATTLSGGEAQRVKLAAHLAAPAREHTLYLFDEPTTGLHFDDIRKLLNALNALVEKGHSIIVIEHNIDVIKKRRLDHRPGSRRWSCRWLRGSRRVAGGFGRSSGEPYRTLSTRGAPMNKSTVLALALERMDGVGRVTTGRLLTYFPTYEDLARYPREQILLRLKGAPRASRLVSQLLDQDFMERQLATAREAIKNYAKRSIQILSATDPDWPIGFADLPRASRPNLLYTYGQTALLNQPSVAFLARPPLDDARFERAQELIHHVIKHKAAPVGGTSSGFDVVVHRISASAPQAHPSMMIANCGLARVDRKVRPQLSAGVKAGGVLVSSFPVEHGPYDHDDRERALIQTALARATVFVEPEPQTPEWNALEWALEANRPVFGIAGAHPLPERVHTIEDEVDFDWVVTAALA